MPALEIRPEEVMPIGLARPRAGSPLTVWREYRDAARAAGCYRAAKAEIPPLMLRRLPPSAPMPKNAKKEDRPLPKGLIPGRPPIKLVIAACGREFGFSFKKMIGKRRKKEVCLARHVAMYLCRTITPRSFPEIGRIMGGRDHSTIHHGFCKIEAALVVDEELRARVDGIKRVVLGKDAEGEAK